MNKLSLTVVIIAYNEEIHIARALRSVVGIASQIFVVDSFSTDRTVEIASEMGATILKHEFINYAKQFQWALDNCPIETDWVMRMDADEYLTPELAVELDEKLTHQPQDVSGIILRLRYVVFGKWMRHGGRYPLFLLRIWRNGKGRIEQRWMDEHIVLSDGRTVVFENDFADHSLKDVGWWTEKHNGYAIREAIDKINKKYQLFQLDEHLGKANASSQASVKRFIKERIYNSMPAFSGPVFYFLYRYFFRLGLLDGKEGFAYHFLQGFWYRVLVEAKTMELERELKTCKDNVTRLEKLEELTGYNFS